MCPENDLSSGLFSDGIASPAIEVHEQSGTYLTQFEMQTRPVTEAILTAVATATGNDPLELPPLYSVIDPDALEALFDPPAYDGSDQRLTVTFEYADCRVTAKAHGTVMVEDN
jgi:hypothetical protein